MTGSPRVATLADRLDALEKAVQVLQRTSRLNSASIGSGGLTIRDGGSVAIEAPGSLYSKYPNGQPALFFGPVIPNPPFDQGLILFDPDGTARAWVTRMSDGTFQAVFGADINTGNVMNLYHVRANTIDLASAGAVGLVGETGVLIDSPGDQMQIGLSASAVFIGHLTTADPANARLDPSGLLMRSTSARKYKTNIRDANIDPETVLKMRGRVWKDKGRVEREGEPNVRDTAGFIAEELHDLGLGLFVEYNEDGEPDAIGYDRLTVALLAVVQSQQTLIETLETRLATLEGKVPL